MPLPPGQPDALGNGAFIPELGGPLVDHLSEAIKGTYDGFNARFRRLPYDWQVEDMKVSGAFLYPPFGADGNATTDQLVEWLYYRIIAFCIPQLERDRADAEYTRTRDDRYRMDIQDKAKGLFVRARESQKTSGEPGELLLFSLLEAILGAPQIACKMYLKTSVNVPVHGSDSIHAMPGEQATSLRVVWGESKTYKGLNSALERICSSIKGFLQPGVAGESPPRSRDIDIIKDHLNVADPALRQVLLDYLDPYSERSNECEEMYACLVAFEFERYAAIQSGSPAEREAEFRNHFEAEVGRACDAFARHIRNAGIGHHRFFLFLVPVPSINAFRRAFFLRLGVPADMIGLTEDETA